MRRVAFFVEDYAHQQIIGALVQRIAHETGVAIECDWRNSRHGYGKLVQELKEYLRDVKRQGDIPDLLVIATDANCKGLNNRTNELPLDDCPVPTRALAIPDPHIERWLLLDGAAFRRVFGRGCSAPDLKCERNRYKDRLRQCIYDAGITPNLGGIEFAEDIVNAMDINRAMQVDDSFNRFVSELHNVFTGWQK